MSTVDAKPYTPPSTLSGLRPAAIRRPFAVANSAGQPFVETRTTSKWQPRSEAGPAGWGRYPPGGVPCWVCVHCGLCCVVCWLAHCSSRLALTALCCAAALCVAPCHGHGEPCLTHAMAMPCVLLRGVAHVPVRNPLVSWVFVLVRVGRRALLDDLD